MRVSMRIMVVVIAMDYNQCFRAVLNRLRRMAEFGDNLVDEKPVSYLGGIQHIRLQFNKSSTSMGIAVTIAGNSSTVAIITTCIITNGTTPLYMSIIRTSGGAEPLRKNSAKPNGGVRKDV